MNNNSIFLPEIAEVISTRQLTEMEKYIELKIKETREFKFNPGQFIQLSIFGIGEAPISISSSPFDKDTIGLCVRKAGDVTSAIHKLETGSYIGIRGPLGNGFPVKEMKGKDLLIIAGGLGLAPLRSLINYVLERRDNFAKITILYGAKNPGEMLFTDELELWKARKDVVIDITVDKPDDNWSGKSGVITRLIPSLDIEPTNTYALVVGPPVMYKYVLLELQSKQISEEHIIMSLERRMKCGIGKCGHCQINGVYVCLDGPEFSYHTLKFLSEAI
ncbi:MAG: Anaerobic sulfite reductase subunit B [Candidatus Scalindua arabica]|uniref:Anaerobic sulfite reductase subunit B n=1 Tax=Candidatus Scalindua arabica TaxID=1127984 RepID=A0A941W121_9BACT|nr:Anaerobic sulfite reductase subunit B [Candidatus Scalindua arabica]